jgi:hypothetical protein
MKRYAVCKVIGDGQAPETAFRAAIEDVIDPTTGAKAFSTSTVLASNPDGTPKYPWCLVVATGRRFDLAQTNPDIDLMPDLPLDVKISAMQTATKAAMTSKMQARGIDTSLVGNSDGYRDVIRALGQLHAPSFNENAFDVSE